MANKNKFQLEIKTPLESVYSGEVNSLLVGTESGEMLVLPHHTALVGSIVFSNIVISNENKIEEYSVRNGFLNIDNAANTVEILCVNCEKKQTVNYTSVESYLKFLDKELEGKDVNEYQLQFLENEKFAVVKQLESLKDK